MANKIKKEKCGVHANDRDISEYVFSVTDIRVNKRKENPIDNYRCKLCKEQLERDLDRERRMREHNKRQQQDALNIRLRKMDIEQAEREKRMNDELWDYVVIKELRKKTKYMTMQDFPDEIIRLKRAQMRFEREIINKKEEQKNKIKNVHKLLQSAKEEQEQKEARIMNQLTCNKHNVSGEEHFNKSGKNAKGEQNYKCKLCMKETHAKNYLKNKDKILARMKALELADPQKRLKQKRDSARRIRREKTKLTAIQMK